VVAECVMQQAVQTFRCMLKTFIDKWPMSGKGYGILD
jgi:hypothetical protein